MKRFIALLLLTLLPWATGFAHPGGMEAHQTPESRQAHTELLAQTISLITSIQAGEISSTHSSKTGTETSAKESPSTKLPTQKTNNPEPTAPKNDGVRITVLGYHDFSTRKKATAMRLPTEKFRKQMQALKDLGMKVISLDDFMAWKRGEKKLDDKSVLITIDDGWKSVYTDAYPILKEFGYPFTVFLYTNYVDGGGSALTTPMIEEMKQHGCSIGSHSISHPYPIKIKAEKKKGEENFTRYLRQEMGQSKKILETKFRNKVTTYAYPGGYVTPEMLPMATECGYQFLFTVLPGKVVRASDNMTLPRYVILGTHDYIFRNATSFKATATSGASQGAIIQTTPYPVIPKPGSLISNRLPKISADLHAVENIDPETIVMRVAGFGKVPSTFDPATQTVSWKINRPLRSQTCKVSVRWKILGEKKYQKPMTWTFRIDREAAYQPKSLHSK